MISLTQNGTGRQPVHPQKMHRGSIPSRELMWSSRSCLHEQGSDADPPLEDTEKCSITTHSLLKRRVSDRGQILGASFLLDDEDSPDILGLTDDVGARHGDLVHVLPIIEEVRVGVALRATNRLALDVLTQDDFTTGARLALTVKNHAATKTLHNVLPGSSPADVDLSPPSLVFVLARRRASDQVPLELDDIKAIPDNVLLRHLVLPPFVIHPPTLDTAGYIPLSWWLQRHGHQIFRVCIRGRLPWRCGPGGDVNLVARYRRRKP